MALNPFVQRSKLRNVLLKCRSSQCNELMVEQGVVGMVLGEPVYVIRWSKTDIVADSSWGFGLNNFSVY